MTHAEVSARVRQNLDDAGITFYKPIDIDDSLSDAYYWASIFANTIEKTANISFQPKCPYYNLLAVIPDLFAVTGVYDLTRDRFLTYANRRDMSGLRSDYECWPGPPEYFFIHSQNYLFIGPQPTESSLPFVPERGLKIFYRAYDDTVIPTNYRLPIAGQDCLEFYATADLLEQAQEWSKAQDFWDRFYKQLVAEKIAIRDRPMPALLNALAGVRL